MAKKFFTDESLATFVNETKTYTNNAVAELSSVVVYASDSNENISTETDGVLASEVSYVNTTSGLSSTNVQAAINELSEETSQLSQKKVDKTNITLEQHTDGLIYIFVDGHPVGNGVELGTIVEGDVIGTLDESNNILLSGNLANGTYTLKYENTDGTYTEIGTLEVGAIPEPEPTYTNFADTTSADWAVDSRFSSGGEVTAASGTNAHITNYIPISRGSVVRVKGMSLTSKIGSSSCRQALYTIDGTNKVFLAVADTSSAHSSYVSVDGNGVSTIIISDDLITTLAINYEPKFIRLNGVLTGTKEDVIITVDEEI